MCINPNAEVELKSPKANLYLEVQDIAIEMTKPQVHTHVFIAILVETHNSVPTSCYLKPLILTLSLVIPTAKLSLNPNSNSNPHPKPLTNST